MTLFFASIIRRIARLGSMMLVFLLANTASMAEEASDAPAGLMWNRTGLPAVFPLQLKTDAGLDYMIVLQDPDTMTDVLAAYAKGGTFFRVLVPPGTFLIRVHYGETWISEEALFGKTPDTRTYHLPAPLTFATKGYGTKAGHLIDLREVPGQEDQFASVTDIGICQTLEPRPVTNGLPARGPRNVGSAALVPIDRQFATTEPGFASPDRAARLKLSQGDREIEFRRVPDGAIAAPRPPAPRQVETRLRSRERYCW